MRAFPAASVGKKKGDVTRQKRALELLGAEKEECWKRHTRGRRGNEGAAPHERISTFWVWEGEAQKGPWGEKKKEEGKKREICPLEKGEGIGKTVSDVWRRKRERTRGIRDQQVEQAGVST